MVALVLGRTLTCQSHLWASRHSYNCVLLDMLNNLMQSHFQMDQLYLSDDLKMWNCSQFPLFANFLILGAAAGSRKTRWNGPVKPLELLAFGIAVFTHFG